MTLSTWKNKLNQGDRTIRVNQWAVESKPDENKSVWDFGSATRAVLKQYLAGYQMLPGGWYRCPGVTETNKRWPDFSAALYENEELIYNLREQMRIKGYGFEFETKYQSARQGGKD